MSPPRASVSAGGPPRTPVMLDVARRAGVSHQTVSRVLNGHQSIRPGTRERVERAIEELGYRRNDAARALVTRRTLAIGVLASSAPLFGPSSTLQAVERAAHAAGYATTLVTTEGTDRSALLAAVGQLVDRGVDGLVVASPLHEVADLRARVPADLPAVVVAGGPVEGMSSVHVDHRAGARAATEHLIALGHREIRHVAGADGWTETVERVGGWRDALAAVGAEAAPVSGGGWSAAQGYASGRALVADAVATAVVAANDQLALGVLKALRDGGVRVPEDISVVGFDDVAEAAYLAPSLTTVHQDMPRVGREAVQLLLTLLDGRPATVPCCVVVPPALVVRESSAPPPRST